MSRSAEAVVLAAIQGLLEAHGVDDVRSAIAHSAWLVSRYDALTLREVQESGEIEITLRGGDPGAASVAVESILCSEAQARRTAVSSLDGFESPRQEELIRAYVRRGGLCLVRPLVAQDELIGLLALHYEGRSALGLEEFAALRRLAVSAGIALSNVRTREVLRGYAYGDALTGLANRRYLEAEFKRLHGSDLSVLLIDFDGLKSVNDALGYDSGDALIREVGAALAGAVAPGETVVRFGGDEFVVLIPGRGAADAAARAEALTVLLDSLELPDEIAPFFQGASIGFATATAGDDPAEVLRRAAGTMRSRKRRRHTDRSQTDPSEPLIVLDRQLHRTSGVDRT